MEEEPPAFYEAVRNGYLALAAAEPQRMRVLDATRTPEEISTTIRSELSHHAFFQGNRL